MNAEGVLWRDERGQHIVLSWCPPELPPPCGRAHGSGGICFTSDRNVVLVTRPGIAWEFPAGRPHGGEDWRATLDREVREEACAVVEEATLLGFVRGVYIDGREKGQGLVRSLWHSKVSLMPWEPRHETTDRVVVPPGEALERVNVEASLRPIYERWFRAALAVEGL